MANAKIIRRIFRGEERGPETRRGFAQRAAALFVAGKTKSLAEGWELAGGTIDGGRAEAKLEELTH